MDIKNKFIPKTELPPDFESGSSRYFVVAREYVMLAAKSSFKTGHKPSQINGWICGMLVRNKVSLPSILSSLEEMKSEEYPMEILWPKEWDGPRKSHFLSYQDYEDTIIKPYIQNIKEIYQYYVKEQTGAILTQDEINIVEMAGEEAARIYKSHKVKAKTAMANPALAEHGGDREQVDNNKNINLKHKGGTSTSYRVAKLKRDNHEIAERLGKGEFKNVREAERAAGLKVPEKKTPVQRVFAAVRRLSVPEQDELRNMLGW